MAKPLLDCAAPEPVECDSRPRRGALCGSCWASATLDYTLATMKIGAEQVAAGTELSVTIAGAKARPARVLIVCDIAMRRTMSAAVTSCIASLLAMACGGSTATAPSSVPTTSSTLSELVNPTLLGVGETAQASATLRSGTDSATVTGQTSWQSAEPSLATVSGTGTVTAIASGLVDIRGQYRDLSATWSLRVLSGSDLDRMIFAVGAGGGVDLQGNIVWDMSIGQLMTLVPRAVFFTNYIYDVLPGTRETWGSSNSSVVSVNSSGQVNAQAAGVADVTATWIGRAGSVRITVF